MARAARRDQQDAETATMEETGPGQEPGVAEPGASDRRRTIEELAEETRSLLNDPALNEPVGSFGGPASDPADGGYKSPSVEAADAGRQIVFPMPQEQQGAVVMGEQEAAARRYESGSR